MSDTVTTEVEGFFHAFEQASVRQDWAGYGAMFLPEFLSIDPTSTRTVAREDLIAFLPQRKAMFEKAGAAGTTLASLAIDALDERHAIARTNWDVVFDAAAGGDRGPVVLRSTFLLRKEDGWRIAVYLNHESLLELLGLA
jgi:uncharacterized protein DUF4440